MTANLLEPQLEEEVRRLRLEVAEWSNTLALERRRHTEDSGHDRMAAIYRAICDQSRHLSGIIALDGTVLHMNRAACELIGKESDDWAAVLGDSLVDTFRG